MADLKAGTTPAAVPTDEWDALLEDVGERFVGAIRELRRNRLSRALQREIYTVAAIELTPVQVDILETVVVRPAMRMNEIAAALNVDASTASRTLVPLVELGLIERRNDSTDRRLIIIEPTASGRAHAERIAEARRELMRSVFHRMAPDRIRLLVGLLEDYIGAVEAEAQGRQKPSAVSD